MAKMFTKIVTNEEFPLPCGCVNINIAPVTTGDTFSIKDITGTSTGQYDRSWSSPSLFPLDSPRANRLTITATGSVKVVYYL